MKKITTWLFCVFTTANIFNLSAQNNALHFNGFNNDITLSYSSMTDFDINDVLTIELWFKTTNNTAVLYSNHIDLAPFAGHEVAVVNGKIVFDMTNDHLANALRVETSSTFNDGNWHHVACVYFGIPNQNGVKIYVDGTLQSALTTHNNLSLSTKANNAPHIGARNSTAYFTNGSIDEVRVWGRPLCSEEIVARKNCHLSGNEPNLLAYYNFNQGTASGNNSTVVSLIDNSGNNLGGTLNNFALSGSTSNWVAANNGISGTCTPFSVSLSVSGKSITCTGTTMSLSATGAQSYTWLPGNKQGSVISVTPQVTTTYTITGLTQGGCKGTAVKTVSVSNCISLKDETGQENTIKLYPNPAAETLFIDAGVAGFEISIYNSLGSRVYSSFQEGHSEKISLSAFTKGIYFVKCTGNRGTFTKTFIKE